MTLKIENKSLHDSPACDHVSSCHVCLQNVQPFRIYPPDEHLLKFLHCCDIDLEHSNPVVSQDSPAQADVPSIVFCEKISSSEAIVERVVFR